MLEAKSSFGSTLVVLSSKLVASNFSTSLILASLALVLSFTAIAGMGEAFADSSSGLPQTLYVQNVHYREMGESLSVASTFGSPGASGQSFTRAISDSVGVTTGFTPPQSQASRAPVDNTSYRSSQPYQGPSQRTEERLNLKNLANTKADSINGKGYGGGTPTNVFSEYQIGDSVNVSPHSEEIQLVADNGGNSDEDSNSLCILEYCIHLENYGFKFLVDNLSLESGIYGKNTIDIIVSGTMIAVVLAPLASRGSKTELLFVVAFRRAKASGKALNRRWIQTILLILILFLAIPSNFYLPPAYGSTVKFGKVVGNNATDTLVADPNVPGSTVIATYTRSDTGATVYTVTKADLDQSLTGNVGNTVTITFTFVQVITSTTGRQYQFMSWTLGGSGWGATTDGRCQTNVVYTTLTDSCKSTNNGGGNTGGPVATYGFRGSPSDTLNVSPALSASKSKGGSPSTTLAVTDSISAKIRKRVITVNIGVTDSITIHVTRSISDSITITDSITTHKSFNESISDTAALSDNIGRTYLATRTPSDSVAVTDSIATTVAISRSVSDSVAVSDSVVRASSVSGSAADALTFTDAITHALSYSRPISDSLAFTVDISRSPSRSISDSVAVTDSIGVTKVSAKSIPDSLTIEDGVTAAVGRARSVADSVTLSDGITTSYHASRTASDTLALTDEVNVESSAKVDIPDTLGTSDSTARQLLASRSVNDSVAVTDSVAATYHASRSANDSLAVAASIATVTNYVGSASDTVTLSDSIAMAVTRDIVESIDLADTPTTSHGTSQAAADSVSLSDGITTKVSRSLSESIQLDSNVSNGRPGSADDDIVLEDDIALAVSKQRADSIGIDDAISIKVTRMIQDEIGITDEARKLASIVIGDSIQVADSTSKTPTKLVADSVAIADAIAMHVSRDLGEELAIEEGTSMSVSRTVSDSISITDSILVSRSSGTLDSLGLDDAISKSITKQTAETLDVGDAISVNVSRSLSDDLAVSDEASPSASRTGEDSVEVADAISIAVSRQSTDEITVTDDISLAISRQLSEDLAVTDDASRSPSLRDAGVEIIVISDEISKSVAKTLDDSMTITDQVVAKITGIAISDELGIYDEIGGGSDPGLNDLISVVDDITVTTNALRLVLIDDSLQVTTSLTNVAWSRTLTLDEPLGLGTEVCMPGVCATNHLVSHSLGMHDSVELVIIPPPELNEEVAVADQITVGKRVSPVPPIVESLAVTDSVTARLVGILIVESKDKVGPMPSQPITGTFTYTGNASDLKNAVIPVPIPINSTVVKPNLPNQITVLRTYSVPVTWSADIPSNNVIMSESQLEVPAYSNMFMRLNFNETPSLAGKKDFISMLDIEFTPKVDSTDFGLVVAVTDKPAPAPSPVDDLKPVYLDVRWWGNFPGAEDPTVSDYYQNPPKFTFTVNDQWVADNNAARDAQGWPVLKLWLLNENTNQWEQITSITEVSSGGGTYTFSATLPHFSNYAITANVGTGGVGGGGRGPNPSSFTVQLTDTLETHEGTMMSAITVIEEFLQPKKVSVFLNDLVTVVTKPVSLPKEIKVDDITIHVAVDEIKQTQLTGPVLAEITVQIANVGEDAKEFELEFTYTDTKGELHSHTVVLEVEGKSMLTKQIELPFADPGTYVVTAEVRELPEGDTVGYSELIITIPWQSLYLYTLLGAAGAIIGVSGIAIALYLLKKPIIPILATAGGVVVALYWRRTKVRLFAMDEEEFKKDHRYEVLGRLTLREVVPARYEFKVVFTLDVWSKNDGREFVVAYRVSNELGELVHESHIPVPAMPGLQSLSILMPFGSQGHYVVQAEARSELGGKVLDKTELPVDINVQ